MGTHSNIYFEIIENGVKITYVVIYQQFDGYPSNVGWVLARFLNRAGTLDTSNEYGSMVLQFIQQEKKMIGNFYIEPVGGYEEWTYVVTYDVDTKTISVRINQHEITYTVDEFLKYCINSLEYDEKKYDDTKLVYKIDDPTFLIRFINDDEHYVTLYGTMDEHPIELVNFLKKMRIVNGIPVELLYPPSSELETMANGFGCLVAQFISKDQTNLRITSPNSAAPIEYIVNNNIKGSICEDKEKLVFTIDQFCEFCT